MDRVRDVARMLTEVVYYLIVEKVGINVLSITDLR